MFFLATEHNNSLAGLAVRISVAGKFCGKNKIKWKATTRTTVAVKSIKHNENPATIAKTKTISDGLQQTKMLQIQKKGENCYVVNTTTTATTRAEEYKGKRKQKRVISTDIDTWLWMNCFLLKYKKVSTKRYSHTFRLYFS